MKKLRKLMIVCMIISMISNYFMILGDVVNIAYASSLVLPLDGSEVVNDDLGESVENKYIGVKNKLDKTSRYKGALLADLMLENKSEFKFKDTIQVEVKKHDLVESFEIEDYNYVTYKDGKRQDIVNEVEYKAITIKESEYRNLIDKDGYIVILDGLDEEIARIDKSVESNSGTFELNFVDGIKNIKIFAFGLREDGKINIEVEKVITAGTSFTKEQILSFDKIEIENIIIPVVKAETIDDEKIEENTTEKQNQDNESGNLLMDNLDMYDVINGGSRGLNSSDEIRLDMSDETDTSSQNTSEVPNTFVQDENEEPAILVPEINEEQAVLMPENNLKISKEIVLEDTKTEVDFGIDTDTLSSSKSNDVALSITLKNDSEKYDTFKNPIFEVLLPESIVSATVEGISLLNKNGLNLKAYEIREKEEGRKALRIELEGEEEKYIVTSLNEAVIEVDLRLDIDRMSTRNASGFELRYINENATILDYESEGKDAEVIEVKFASTKEMLKLATFSNFNNSLEKKEELNNSRIVMSLDTNGVPRNVQVSFSLANNLKSDISDVEIVGIIPNTNNTNEKGYSYKNSFDMNINQAILTNGISAKVLYSTELNYVDPKWEEEVPDLGLVRMFKIKIDSNVVHQNDRLDLSYVLDLPEGLRENNMSYGEYIICYNYNGQDIKEKVMFGFETEKIAVDNSTLFDNSSVLREVAVENITDRQNTEKEETAIENMPSVDVSDIETRTDNADNEEENTVEIEDIIAEKEVGETSESQENINDNDIRLEDNNQKQESEANQEEGGLEVKSIIMKGNEILGENEKVDEGQVLKFKYSVKNTSGQELHNIALKGNANDANMYVYNKQKVISDTTGEMVIVGDWVEDFARTYKEENMHLDSLLPNETVIFEYQVVTNELFALRDDGEGVVYGKLEVDSAELTNQFFETTKHNIEDGDVEIYLHPATHYAIDDDVTYTKDGFHIAADVVNISSETLNNVVVDFYLDGKLSYAPSSVLYYPEDIVTVEELPFGQKVSVVISEIKPGEYETAQFLSVSCSLDTSIYSTESNYYARTNVNGKEYKSNECTREITQDETSYEYTLTSDMEGRIIKTGDPIHYTLTVENTGVITKHTNVYDYLDNSLDVQDVELYDYQEGTWVKQEFDYFEEEIINYYFDMKPGQKIKFEIYAIFDEDGIISETQHEIENKLWVENSYKTKLTNEIEFSEGYWSEFEEENTEVVEDNSSEEENVRQPLIKKENISSGRQSFLSLKGDLMREALDGNLMELGKYKISGNVWIDKNKNSIKDDGGIDKKEVLLFDVSNGSVDMDKPTLATMTANGKYEFADLPSGKYVIALEYDGDNYKSSTSENGTKLSSKSIGDKSYIVTNEITIDNKDISNVDIGLIEIEKYDISVNAGIDEIIISGNNGDRNITFDAEDEAAEVKLTGKELEESNINASFYVTVENKGSIAGYINQISATVPDGWIFDKELNIDWTQGKDGKIYSEKLKNITIDGDTNSFRSTLILKKSDSVKFKDYDFKFEIDSSSNILGKEDINKENDNEAVNLLISRKHSKIWIVLILVLIIIVLTLMLFNHKKINALIFNKVMIMIIAFICVSGVIGMNTYHEAETLTTLQQDLRKIYDKSGNIVNTPSHSENINSWAIGKIYNGLSGSAGALSMNADYDNVVSYMSDLYGYTSGSNTRRTFLYNGGSFRKTVRRAENWQTSNGGPNSAGTYGTQNKLIRTVMCMHGASISVTNGHGTWIGLKNSVVSDDGVTLYSFLGTAVEQRIFATDALNNYATLINPAAITEDTDALHPVYGHPYVFKGFYAAVVDFGWDQGYAVHGSGDTLDLTPDGEEGDESGKFEWFTRATGTAMSGLFFGGNANYNNHSSSDPVEYSIHAAQVMGYGGWLAEYHKVSEGTGIYDKYKEIFQSVFRKYPSQIKSIFQNLSGIYVNPALDAGAEYAIPLLTAMDGYTKNFIDKNHCLYHDHIVSDLEESVEEEDSDIDSSDLGESEIISSKSIEVKSNLAGKTLKSTTVNDKEYARIKVLFPIYGDNNVYKNKTFLYYKKTSGGWAKYEGKFYTINSDGEITGEYSQSEDYGMNNSSEYNYKIKDATNKKGKFTKNKLNNKYIYFEVPDDLKECNNNIQVRNSYLLYASRNIPHLSRGDQENIVYRGIRYKNNSRVSFTLKGGTGVTIEKTIEKIHSDSNKKYAEKGCNIVYKVVVKSTKDKLDEVTFEDTFTSGYLKYIGMDSSASGTFDSTPSGWSLDESEFTYTGDITTTGVTLYLKYEVIGNSKKDQNQKVNNTVTITYVEAGGKVIYNPSASPEINELDANSILESTVSFWMRMYKVDIEKTVNASYFEKGDTVTYTITVKNDGEKQESGGQKYGKIKGIVVQDELPSKVTYVSYSGTGWTKASDSMTFTYNEEIDYGDTASFTITGTVNTVGVHQNIRNTATINTIKNHHSNDVTSVTNGNLTDYADINIKGYKISVNKEVMKVTSGDGSETDYYKATRNKTEKVYAEAGDMVIYKMTVSNIGSGDLYGNIKDFVVEDEFESDELVYKEFGDTIETSSSTNWSYIEENKFGYSGSVAKGNSVSFYIKFEFKKLEKTNDAVVNKIKINSLKNKNDYSISTSELMSVSVLEETDTIYSKKYQLSVNKEVMKVTSGDGSIVEYNKATRDKTETVYAEAGDIVYFKITLENTGTSAVTAGDSEENTGNSEESTGTQSAYGAIKNITLLDVFESDEFVYISFGDTIEAINEDTASTSWTKTSDYKFNYSGRIANGDSTSFYIKMRFTKMGVSSTKVDNTIRVDSLENRNSVSVPIDKLTDESVIESVDSLYSKSYSVSVRKHVIKVKNPDSTDIETFGTDPDWTRKDYTDSQKETNKIYAEPADIVTYEIRIKNTGADSSYGDIKGISLNDKYTYKTPTGEYGTLGTDESIIKFVSFGTSASNYSSENETTVDGWTRVGNVFTYAGTLGKGDEARILVKYSVERITSTNDIVKNQAEIIGVLNRNNVIVMNEDNDNLVTDSNKISYDVFTIKIYKAQVIKDIVKIDGKTDTEQKEITGLDPWTGEVGDVVEYRITIRNNGESPTHGALKTVNVSDLFETDELEYVSISSEDNCWSIDTSTNGDFLATTETGISVGDESSFTLNMLVIYRSKEDDQMIVNTAEIKTTNEVTNKNDVNIRSVLNGDLDDSAEFRYLTYHIDFRKYMDTSAKVGTKTRYDLTNNEKYDNPIEHEKYEEDTYILRLENTGETVLYQITFTDEMINDLEFKNYGDSWSVDSIRLYDNDKPVSSAEDKTSKLTYSKREKTQVQFLYNDSLSPGEYLIIKMSIKILKSNTYLWNLENEANVPSVWNKHDIEIRKTDDTPNDIMNLDVYENKEYIRMKNLIIQGTVWEDTNRDGVMDSEEHGIPNITVSLVDVTNGKKAVIMTDSQGKYKFTETNGIDIYTGEASSKKMIETDGRVIKATNRNDTTGNYYSKGRFDEYKAETEKDIESSYINYYIEYNYNGSKYIASVYSGDTNLEKPGYALKEGDAYKTDSNATEFQDMRESYQDRVEIVNYNNTISSSEDYNSKHDGENSYRLRYNKTDHVSDIINDLSEENGNPVLTMSAFSFVKDATESGLEEINASKVDYLWLNRNDEATDDDCYTGETEYLKYINLGLEVQQLDLQLEKDLYSVRTTINGEEVVYKYDQGNNGANNSEYTGPYATGYEESETTINTKNYSFKFYSSDYTYRSTQYQDEEVKTYKDGTELDTEITYKITIKNLYTANNFNDDTREHLYAVVNEITDYYPIGFVQYDPTSNEKTEKLFDKSEDGTADYLSTHEGVPIIEAYYYDDDANKTGKHTLTLSNSTSYPIKYDGKDAVGAELNNKDKTFSGYNKLYIGGASSSGEEKNLRDIVLDWNDSKNIYIKYTVKNDPEDNDNLMIDNGNSVAEINSYATYEKLDSVGKPTNPAGYIDINSNPGNVGYNKDSKTFDDLFNYKEYENDTYKTGVDMSVKSKTPPTDDPPGEDPPGEDPPGEDPEKPSEENPGNSTGAVTLEDTERVIVGMVWDDARSEETGSEDTTYEEGDATQYLGNGKYDASDEKLADARKNSKIEYFNKKLEKNDNPVGGVKVRLVELVSLPNGKVIEETINTNSLSQMITVTEMKDSGDIGTFRLQGFIPGQYIVRYDYGYSSANNNIKKRMLVYNGQDYKSTTYNSKLDDVEITDTINANSPDGDRVLEAMTGRTREYGKPKEEITVDDTNYSDARDDAIRRLCVNGYSEYMNNKKSNVLQRSSNDLQKELFDNTNMFAETPIFPVRIEDDLYMNTTVEYEYTAHQDIMKLLKRYSLEGVDFGIEYRPEADIDLTEYITEVKVLTNSNKVLYDLKYDIDYKDNVNKRGRIVKTELNKNTSVGLANVQRLPNDIHTSSKGFIYLNVDTDTMQGTQVEIYYVLNINNISEVDRISSELYGLTHEYTVKGSGVTSMDYEDTGYIPDGATNSIKQYRATWTAMNNLKETFMKGTARSNTPRTASNYYGKYLGNTYYTGSTTGKYATGKDEIVKMKIAGILDYVDNDMVFESSKNQGKNNYWRATTSSELFGRGMMKESNYYLKTGEKPTSLAETIRNMLTLLDNKMRRYDTDANNTRLALIVDDSITGADDENNINESITKYLIPEVVDAEKSGAMINLVASKTISSQTDANDMRFDNVAEVVNYRALSGRVTTLNSHSTKSTNGGIGDKVSYAGFINPYRLRNITVGNANLSEIVDTRYGDNASNTSEPDTAMTETVSLLPPTGKYKLSYYLNTHRDLLKIFEVTIGLMICVPIVTIIIKKFKKSKKVYK